MEQLPSVAWIAVEDSPFSSFHLPSFFPDGFTRLSQLTLVQMGIGGTTHERKNGA